MSWYKELERKYKYEDFVEIMSLTNGLREIADVFQDAVAKFLDFVDKMVGSR